MSFKGICNRKQYLSATTWWVQSKNAFSTKKICFVCFFFYCSVHWVNFSHFMSANALNSFPWHWAEWVIFITPCTHDARFIPLAQQLEPTGHKERGRRSMLQTHLNASESLFHLWNKFFVCKCHVIMSSQYKGESTIAYKYLLTLSNTFSLTKRQKVQSVKNSRQANSLFLLFFTSESPRPVHPPLKGQNDTRPFTAC